MKRIGQEALNTDFLRIAIVTTAKRTIMTSIRCLGQRNLPRCKSLSLLRQLTCQTEVTWNGPTLYKGFSRVTESRTTSENFAKVLTAVASSVHLYASPSLIGTCV